MSQNYTPYKVDPARETEERRRARAEMRQQLTLQAEQRRAETRAEYDSVGDDRRARSARLKALRLLKEAKDRVDARTS
jgi:hypothetical protein